MKEYSKGRKPFANTEEEEKYYIGSEWFKKRKPGISVMMRCYNEEEWIGPVLESILPFMDEIVIAYTEGGDRTRRIIESFDSPKIRICEYPFKIDVNNKDYCSVHNISYFSNWGLAKTSYSHASIWDADMIMIPKFCNKKFYDFVLSKNVVRIFGINVATPDFAYMSKIHPYAGKWDVRFIKLNKHTFYECTKIEYEEWSYRGIPQLLNPLRWFTNTSAQIQRIKNGLMRQDVKVEDAVYLHTKPLKIKYGEQTKDKYTDFGQYKKYEWYLDVANQGKKIDIEIPDFVAKIPEDYL